jgi:ribosome recycling factor
MLPTLSTQLRDKLAKALAYLSEELKKIRGGRAHPGILDGLLVENYGQKTPLMHVARVLASDARTLTITPYDSSTLPAITKAIREDQALGLNPMDDGKVVRITMPEMTTERREQILKLVSTKAEECRIAIRATRHDLLEDAKAGQKSGEITEDEFKRFDQEVTKAMDGAQKSIDEQVKAKETEVMTV